MNPLALLGGVGSLWGTVFGSKAQRDRHDADAKAAASSQFAAEFGHSRNWFDSLIDGLNRLPRPVFAFGTIYLFIMCWNDPEAFVAGAVNLELMPQEMWWILGTIVVFFFGGRLHKDFGKYKIQKDVLQKYQAPSAALKTERRVHNSTEPDPQENLEWDDRVDNRYSRTDWDNLN